MIKEILAEELITFECPPDGEIIPIIDPYDGCTMGCPYCFQRNNLNWNKDLIIKLNLPQLINEQGIKVWTFITPILPGITDVNKMIGSLNKDIPVYLDKLRLEKGSIPAQKMLEYINNKYPRLKSIYEDIIFNDSNEYINELRSTWKNNSRVKFVFD